jgi:hypothetical protein
VKKKREFCPAPTSYSACKDSANNNKCCYECNKRGKCANVCLNAPWKCGRHRHIKEYDEFRRNVIIDKNGVEWVDLPQVLKIFYQMNYSKKDREKK